MNIQTANQAEQDAEAKGRMMLALLGWVVFDDAYGITTRPPNQSFNKPYTSVTGSTWQEVLSKLPAAAEAHRWNTTGRST